MRIGYSMCLTGLFAQAAPSQVNAYELWKDQVNAAGGLEIGGQRRPVEFVSYDDQSNPANAVRIYEKLITDIEVLQMMAELFSATPGDADAIAFEAIREIQPGGHFFAAEHTMARYRTAFYEPFVADWSNFGNWTAAGGKDATRRANVVWKDVLEQAGAPAWAAELGPALDEFIERRKTEGGASPVS